MSIYKNGVWKENNLYEPPLDRTKGISYDTEQGDYLGVTWEHTPLPQNNSSFAFAKVHHEDNPGKIYHISLTVEWTDFLTDMPENFDIYWQGYYYSISQEKWVWSNSPDVTALANQMGLNELVRSAATGTYQYEVDFTTSSTITISNLRYRSNYSNGTGTLKFSNLSIVPRQYALSSVATKKIEDAITANSFIEI